MIRQPHGAFGPIAVLIASTLLTIAIAWPVLRAPNSSIFGRGIDGWYADPFIVMLQIAGKVDGHVFAQPLTDGPGWMLARMLSPVAAYNALVLMTFPLAAVSAFALSRYLFDSSTAAWIAALSFAFAPVHLAHAAYHPHIAQVQWVPLYLLALFGAVDRPTAPRLAALVAAVAGLTLSNLYAGLIGAVLTPVALVGYWMVSPRAARGAPNLVRPALILAGVAASAVASVRIFAPRLVVLASAQSQPVQSVEVHSARWWAFLLPAVDHPWFGELAAGVHLRNLTLSLAEQQLFVGYTMLSLAGIGFVRAVARWRDQPAQRTVVALAAIGMAAGFVAIGSIGRTCDATWWAPACRIHDWLPLFRAYARFGIAAQLCLALLAGLGAAALVESSRAKRTVMIVLLAAIAFEYWPLPWRVRDVRPTDLRLEQPSPLVGVHARAPAEAEK